MAVDTTKVEGRRKLDYASFEELLADADRAKAGPVKTLGNWSAGQIFRHVALVMNCSMDGFPMTFPWYMRLMAKMFRTRILAGAMPSGFKLPVDGQPLVPPPTSTEEGLAELHAAVARLTREPHRVDHPAFGPMSAEQWNQLHLKHASMHMSFFVPS
jgi:hypothetical protein